MPVEYTILDYDRVNPVQVLFEGPLSIMSTYKVADKFSIIYADLLRSSMKAFDVTVWLLILVSFFVFSGLLFIRKCVNNVKEAMAYKPVLTICRKEQKAKRYSRYLPLFETFAHFIRQKSTEFDDRSGNFISIVMTIGFFFILVVYQNVMSTELVVITKPHVINTYKDIMDDESITVGFFAMNYDVKEFEAAEEGSIQQNFWKKYSRNHTILDSARDSEAGADFGNKVINQKAVLILTSMFSHVFLEQSCKMLEAMKSGTNFLGNTYGWIASDPKGKQHTMGFIIRQGLNNDLIKKGKRRLKGFFEGSIFDKALSESVAGVDVGSMFDGIRHSNIRKCLSKTVNFNHPEVEKVNVRNFKYLAGMCLLFLLVSLTTFIGEILHAKRRQTKVRPIQEENC